MNILGIDTSGREGSLALRSGGRVVGQKSLSPAGRRHAQTLVAELDSLLREAGLAYSGLDNVAISIGPGSFTGLRVGVACAKTLAWATGCQIAAVDTLGVIAENSPAEVDSVSVISDAQRGDLFVGDYCRSSDGHFERAGEIRIVDAEGWCAQCAAGSFVTGPGLSKYADDLNDAVHQLEPGRWHPVAANVGLLGERQIEDGDIADLWSLEPLYLRRSAAEEKRDAV